jgi:uncharacterized GH25 family protein
MIQALVFGDGGITAISANCFNIAFIGSFVGYWFYRLIVKVESYFRHSPDKGRPTRLTIEIIGTAVGSYIGMNAAALFTALELGLQPLIYGSAGAGYFPYSLTVALPAVMIPHLTLVGPLEAGVAALVITFLRRGNASIFKFSKAAVMVVFSISMIFQSWIVSAHDFFIEPKREDFIVVFGHGKEREDFDLNKIKQVKVFDLQGKDIPVQREKKDKDLVLKMSSRPSLLWASIDNGYWSKTIYGWKELPKRKASRVVEAIRSLFFTKMILAWNEGLKSASSEAGLDITPLKNPFELKAGESLMLKAFLRGQPLPGAEVIGMDHNKLGKTDQEGSVKVTLARGQNLLTVEFKEPLKNDPDADVLTLTATLTFEVKK